MSNTRVACSCSDSSGSTTQTYSTVLFYTVLFCQLFNKDMMITMTYILSTITILSQLTPRWTTLCYKHCVTLLSEWTVRVFSCIFFFGLSSLWLRLSRFFATPTSSDSLRFFRRPTWMGLSWGLSSSVSVALESISITAVRRIQYQSSVSLLPLHHTHFTYLHNQHKLSKNMIIIFVE